MNDFLCIVSGGCGTGGRGNGGEIDGENFAARRKTGEIRRRESRSGMILSRLN